jgi:hypothetical protein
MMSHINAKMQGGVVMIVNLVHYDAAQFTHLLRNFVSIGTFLQ